MERTREGKRKRKGGKVIKLLTLTTENKSPDGSGRNENKDRKRGKVGGNEK